MKEAPEGRVPLQVLAPRHIHLRSADAAALRARAGRPVRLRVVGVVNAGEGVVELEQYEFAKSVVAPDPQRKVFAIPLHATER